TRKELERRNADSNLVKDENALGRELERLKAEGKLPVIVRVHTDHYPFHPAKADEAGGVGGTHLATITDYDPATGRVKIDNQWGSKWDLPDQQLSKRDLFEAMQEPDDKSHIARLEDEVHANRQADSVDFLKETQLLRLKRGAKMLDDKALSAEIEDQYKAFLLKEKSDVSGANGERDKMVRAEFQELRAKLSRAEQQKLDARMKAF